ncbi:RteC domain-containing protein [Flavobacterium adhaerens]|uniref:RteC domain-containing protein n=1 Tax=Flavobacterium adhaerens TaxID=3149043 RepID=UPI0032B61094
MKVLQQVLQDEFLQKTNEITNLNTNRISCCKVYILWAEAKIAELHDKLKDYDFETEQEEINFFKKIKPFVISKLIFEKEVLRIETDKPHGKLQKRKYFEQELAKISNYRQKDFKFYQYYRSDNKESDKIYFTRASKKNIFETECFLLSSDPKLSTCYDYKVAKILAFDELVNYLENQIISLKKRNKLQKEDIKSKMNWSGTKIDLIELIYALYFQKVINNGNIELKEIAKELGSLFNIELNENIYRFFTDIKNRKQSKTKFINTLSDNFNVKILEEDF